MIKPGSGSTPGFSPGSDRKWKGFFVDIGKALSIAVFGTPDSSDLVGKLPTAQDPRR
ncbi:hypothetical protein [Paenirhodobacter sp.]|uniref:hypothetical protein n=1 Tax=Paenirhodobacter sp. TaxID=1965326 RepID=UPI003B3F5C68